MHLCDCIEIELQFDYLRNRVVGHQRSPGAGPGLVLDLGLMQELHSVVLSFGAGAFLFLLNRPCTVTTKLNHHTTIVYITYCREILSCISKDLLKDTS